MSYITKQKFSLNDLLPPRDHKIVGIVEAEEYLAKLYQQYLSRHAYGVHICSAVHLVGEFVYTTSPDLLVINPDIFQKLDTLVGVIEDLIEAYPKLLIVTIGYNSEHEQLRQLMSAGIVSHLNRKLSRPQDLVIIVKSLLQN